MLKYIAAVATAVTLSLTSGVFFESSTSSNQKGGIREEIRPMHDSYRLLVDALPTSAVLDGNRPYVLSNVEQRALRRALLRSVRFLDAIA